MGERKKISWEAHVLAGLTRISQAVASVQTVGAVGAVILAEICRLIPVRCASLMRYDATEGCLRIVAARGMSERLAQSIVVRPGEGVSGKVFAEGRPRRGRGSARRRYRGKSYLVVPLLPAPQQPDTAPLGVLNLTDKLDGTDLTPDECAFVELAAQQAATFVHLGQLADGAVAHAQLAQELQLARRIQQRCAPQQALRTADCAIAGWCEPAGAVGGDYFDFWRQGRIATMLCVDVAGHDVGAALTMIAVRTIVRQLRTQWHTPPMVLQRLHDALCSDLQLNEQTVSAMVVQYDPATRNVHVASAGHPPVAWWRASAARVRWIDGDGPPLGAVTECHWPESIFPVSAGDMWVALSDGVLGRLGGRSLRQGQRRFARWLRQQRESHDGAPLIRNARSMLLATPTICPSRDDDMTLVGLRILQ